MLIIRDMNDMVQRINIETPKSDKAYRLRNAIKTHRNYFQSFRNGRQFLYPNERSLKKYEKILKQFFTGVLTLATVFTDLPTSQVLTSDTQYWTDVQEKEGYIEKISTAVKQSVKGKLIC